MADQTGLEFVKQFRQSKEKYAYYVVGLCVAAIGFSIVRTKDDTLAYTHIPLALAVISWSLSIYSGLKFISHTNQGYSHEIDFLSLSKNLGSAYLMTQDEKNMALVNVKKAERENNISITKYHKWMHRYFYGGVVMFLSWHIITMSIRTQ